MGSSSFGKGSKKNQRKIEERFNLDVKWEFVDNGSYSFRAARNVINNVRMNERK